MKQIFTAFAVLLFSTISIVSAQTIQSYSSIKSGFWDDPSTWDCSCIPTSGILIIEQSHVVQIDDAHSFDGTIEIYGSLVFLKNNGNKGELTMNATSKILIASGGHIDAVTDDGNSVNATWLSIGGLKLNGSQINALAEPNQINYQTIEDAEGGCYETQDCDFTPLPVELLYFRSQINAQGVQLEWASVKEWNFSHYTVERSENGRDFTAIHDEFVSGESTTLKTYRFLDQRPVYGANYYRLKTTDIDGTVEYKGLTLAYAGTNGNLRVSPNPAKGSLLTINYPGATAEGTWLSILSAAGNEIMKIQMPEKELRIPTEVLAPGVYIIKVANQLETKQSRLIVQ